MNYPCDEQIIAGKVARDAIKLGVELCAKGGITGEQLDRQLEEYIRDHQCVPSLKGYKPPFTDRTYYHTICLARNEAAVHGVPSSDFDPLNDLITIDLVVGHKGWHADTARTFTFSSSADKKNIAQAVHTLHTNALSIIQPNASILSYSSFCEKVANKICNVAIIREFCGHGVGRGIHEEPQVPCTPSYSNHIFEIGRSYAVEPVIAAKRDYKLLDGNDGWTVYANCLTAHMEDTIFVSQEGIINLTN